MFARLLLLFTLVPLVELFLLIWIGEQIGLGATLALVLGTGALGAWLARGQGLRAVARVRSELADGRLPAEALVDGVLIFIAGALLLTPGLLTDLAGFFLLAPAGRRLIRRAVSARLRRHFVRSAAGTAAPQVIIIEPDRDRDRDQEP